MEETLRPAKKLHIRLKTGDFVLVAIVAALVVFGVIMVFSASYYSSISESGDPYEYLISSLQWVAIGTVAFLICALLNYHIWYRFATAILVVGFVLLGLIFTPLGITLNHATRWLGYEGFPFTVMPGEIAKVVFIIFTAYYLTKYPKAVHPLQKPLGFLILIGLTGAACLLIYKQPNLSTLLTLGMIVFFMMIIAGLHWGWLIVFVGGIFGGALGLKIFLPNSYWTERILSFTDPFADKLGTGWQVVQSIYGLASGGFKGVGLGNSVAKALYLPEPQNDFILAIIGEECGFIGCFLLLCAYAFLIYRCVRIAINAPDTFGTLLASGITIMLSLQVIMNVAVVTSTMPPTGVALPFISYGGNSMVIFLASMGILLNISRQSAKKQEETSSEETEACA